MLSESIKATRETLKLNKEPGITDGLIEVLHAFEILARDLEAKVEMLSGMTGQDAMKGVRDHETV